MASCDGGLQTCPSAALQLELVGEETWTGRGEVAVVFAWPSGIGDVEDALDQREQVHLQGCRRVGCSCMFQGLALGMRNSMRCGYSRLCRARYTQHLHSLTILFSFCTLTHTTMAASIPRSRCLFSSSTLKAVPRSRTPLRTFATTSDTPQTAVPEAPTKRSRPPTSFSDTLNAGPSFGDFVNPEAPLSPAEAYEIKTVQVGPEGRKKTITRLPEWLRTPIPSNANQNYKQIKKDLRGLNLATVCEEARCPNISDCWGGSSKSAATATIMLMGDTCTRGCRFCAVKTSKAPPPLDPHEPENTAEALRRWGLGYVVITVVDRDDLVDSGAHHIAETIMKIKQKNPTQLVELLGGDYGGNLEMAKVVARSGVDVFAHNIETTERLTPFVRDRRAKFRQSLDVLRSAKEARPELITKTSMMLGLGETDEDLWHALRGTFIQPDVP